MNATDRLGLPTLFAGQAAKETTHNEALLALDALVAAAVEEGPRDGPPSSPAPGSCYIVGAAPTGDWSGKPDHLATYTAGGWRFSAPVDGMVALVKASGLNACYRDGEWAIGILRAASVDIGGEQVLGPRADAIPNPAGGAQADAEARTAIIAILNALRAHGLIASAS